MSDEDRASPSTSDRSGGSDPPDESARTDSDRPTAAQVASFEAGIKFGALYHQFAGTPVSPESAASLSTAMAAAIENQPHCEQVTVEIEHDRLATAIAASPAEYVELTGRYLDVEIEVEYEGVTVTAQMSMTDGYPLMEIVDITQSDD